MTSCPAACTALVYLTKFSIACSAPYLFRLCRSYCGQALQEFCVINLISNWAEGEEAQQPRRSSAFLPRDLLHLPGLQQCEVGERPGAQVHTQGLRVVCGLSAVLVGVQCVMCVLYALCCNQRAQSFYTARNSLVCKVRWCAR